MRNSKREELGKLSFLTDVGFEMVIRPPDRNGRWTDSLVKNLEMFGGYKCIF